MRFFLQYFGKRFESRGPEIIGTIILLVKQVGNYFLWLEILCIIQWNLYIKTTIETKNVVLRESLFGSSVTWKYTPEGLEDVVFISRCRYTQVVFRAGLTVNVDISYGGWPVYFQCFSHFEGPRVPLPSSNQLKRKLLIALITLYLWDKVMKTCSGDTP